VRGGQATAYTDAMLDKLANDVAHVPALLPLEFSNVVRKVLTGKKITEERAREIMQTQAGLALIVHAAVPDPAENMALALRPQKSALARRRFSGATRLPVSLSAAMCRSLLPARTRSDSYPIGFTFPAQTQTPLDNADSCSNVNHGLHSIHA
jgi:hypothetical protein